MNILQGCQAAPSEFDSGFLFLIPYGKTNERQLCERKEFVMCVASLILAAVLTIAERNREPTVEIGVPAGSSPSVRYAAEELRDHVREMTGVELPIVDADGTTEVTISEIADPGLGTDGFRLRGDNGKLRVEGGRRGVLYGVYEILETYGGCGWYSSFMTIVPRRDSFSVPADFSIERKPAFRTRELLWFDASHPDFAARLRLNGNYHRPTARHGGNEFRFGGGLGNCHTFAKLVPVDEYFDAHPEYFSEVGGKRIREQTQLCLSNPEVLEIVTEKVLSAIRRDPGATYFGVSQNDWQGFCSCAKCRAVDEEEGSRSGSIIRFVNAVADEVAKEFPDKIIETLAYQYSRKPPLKTRPRKNVMVCLCTIECDFSTPLSAGAVKANAEFAKDIQAWSKMTDKLYIWDYTTNFKCYLQPFANLDVLQPNLEFFRKNGAVSILEQGAHQGLHADLAELKTWLLAKLMWNPHQRAEPLIEKFASAYYGDAAPFVMKYLAELRELQLRRSKKGGTLSVFEDTGASVCDAAFLDRAVSIWRDAERAVAGDGKRRYNVRMSALPTMYMLFMNQCREFSVARASKPRTGGKIDPKALAKWIKATLDMAKKKIRVSESGAADRKLAQRLRSVSEASGEGGSGDGVVIPMDRLRTGRMAEVAGSVSEKVFAPPNTGYDWYVPLQFGSVAYDDGMEYRIRLRVKVECAGGKRDGEAFWAGIYDNAVSQGKAMIAKKTSECADGWQWHEVAKLKLSDSYCLWVGSGRFDRNADGGNPALKQVYFDAVEIIRADLGEKQNKGER